MHDLTKNIEIQQNSNIHIDLLYRGRNGIIKNVVFTIIFSLSEVKLWLMLILNPK